MRLLGNAGGGAWRAPVETVLRVAVLGLLAWSAVQSYRERSEGAVEVSSPRDMTGNLVRWSTVARPSTVHTMFDAPPPLHVRDWLAALSSAGTAVTWSGSGLVPTAAVIEPIADPMRGADFLMAAPERTPISLRDALGVFDSLSSGPHGIRVHLSRPPGMIEAMVGTVATRAPLQDSLVLGRLLVLAHAGWEGKFAAAALEERGWKVDAVLAVSPHGQGDVRQGKVLTIDTATYAAVLAIDTVAARYAEPIVRYVRSGGGLVVWPEAARVPAFAPLLAGQSANIDTAMANQGGALPDSQPRRALTVVPVTNLRTDAVVLEQQSRGVALAARRIGPGRVLQMGYIDSWRWRMGAAGTSALAAHREWLARLIASVAYTGRRSLPAQGSDAAPLATLVDRLGAPTPALPSESGRDPVLPWVFAALLALLLVEWGSRRLRGAT